MDKILDKELLRKYFRTKFSYSGKINFRRVIRVSEINTRGGTNINVLFVSLPMSTKVVLVVGEANWGLSSHCRKN